MKKKSLHIAAILFSSISIALLVVVSGLLMPESTLGAQLLESASGTPVFLPHIAKHYPPSIPTPTPTVPTPSPTPGTGPEVGQWMGTTSRDLLMSFEVSTSGASVKDFMLFTNFDFGACWGTVRITVPGPLAIVEGAFGYDLGTYSFSGEFTSTSTASGSYSFESYYISGCNSYLTQSGAWTAAKTLLDWQIETVDSMGNTGHSSLVLDSAGLPHIAYHPDMSGYLKYAYYTGSSWQFETVDDTIGLGYYGDYSVSLALDAQQRPRIVYHDGDQNDLKYARYNGTAWSIETVDSDSSITSSMALDSNGRPHISYRSDSDQVLKYAYFDGVDWQIETVDSTYNVGVWSSLALDSGERPHISYNDASNRDLKYAYYDGATWHIETVDSVGDVGSYTSLALDSLDRPQISYHQVLGVDLKYAHFNGSNWQIETVVRNGIYSKSNPLVLDSADWPHICTRWDGGGGDMSLMYLWYDGAAWQVAHVSTVPVGECSLALDSAGNPAISYYEYRGLKYAQGSE